MTSEIVDAYHKGWPSEAAGVPLDGIAERRWNLFEAGFLLPVMVLKRSALEHNVETMARFCQRHGVSLAPHGKTTMSPEIVAAQLDAGAWAITAATAAQARAFRRLGIGRIVIANQVLDRGSLRWLAGELDEHPEAELICLVDAIEGVELMEAELERMGAGRRVPVLVELGVLGGRTGARAVADAESVAHAVRRCAHLELAGVEAYAGVIHRATDDVALHDITALLRSVRDLVERLASRGAFGTRSEILVSAGGSQWFDAVVELLGGPWRLDLPVRTVLRSGCYVTHDSGIYRRASPFDGRGVYEDDLKPALEVWAVVQSVPEPGLAIAGFGKRDVPYDIELPVPLGVRGRDGSLRAVGEVKVIDLNDQHAYLRVDGAALAVGELLRCGISHPCTAFDKWRLIPVVEDDYTVTGAARTLF
ncbi:MAG: alanine racemase [Actinomycetota bacterium]